jgi:VIT1/CCC1 family predicted Fe2+/Mn2+ transporter
MTTHEETKQAPDRATLRVYQANLDDEIDGIALYGLLAEAERNPDRKSIFTQLAAVENRHANIWRGKLREAGVEPKEHGPSLRVRMIGFLARRFGVRSILPIVRSMEAGAYSMYMAQDETAQAIAPDEHEHGRAIARLLRPEVEPVAAIAEREKWHRTGGGGTLRATVFGVSDGLLSNTSLIMGFAGANTEGKFVLLAGIAGLLAGAFSMGVGEYVSMRAQKELFERQIELERGELEAAPAEEQEELALIYQAKGLPRAEAESMAARLMENPQIALETLVREELGLDPSELGSPWGASIGSFLAFAVGALVPVIPFLFGANASLPFVVASGGLAAVSAFAVGASLSLFTGRHPLLSGGRQVALGAVAAALTFAIGRAIGVSAGV